MPKKQRKKQRKPMGTYVYGGRRTGMGVTVEQSGVPRPDGWSATGPGRADGLEHTAAGLLPPGATCPGNIPVGLSRADFAVGTKVVRGPAWCAGRRMYGDQDGGEGQLGTVVELPPQLASKPEHRAGQWVAVQWRATNVLGTYRAGGAGHEGVFDIVPWESDPEVEAFGASSLLDLCDAYQRRDLTIAQFKQGLRQTGCPDDAMDAVVAMVEAKGMAPAPEPEPAPEPVAAAKNIQPSDKEQGKGKGKERGEDKDEAVSPPSSPLRTAVVEVTRQNPGMGVKKLVALVKQSSPDLAGVGAKEVRQMIAELNE